jgi:hypothetical protein
MGRYVDVLALRSSSRLASALGHDWTISFCVFSTLGGVFQLKLVFSEEYPQKPPKVKFTQHIFHPNGKHTSCECPLSHSALSRACVLRLINLPVGLTVFGDGSLCLDIIQDKWTPVRRHSLRLNPA